MRRARFRGRRQARQTIGKVVQVREHAMETVNSTKQHRVAQWVHGPPRDSLSLEVTFELSLRLRRSQHVGSGQEGLRERGTPRAQGLKGGQCGWSRSKEASGVLLGGKGQVGTGSCFLSRAEGLALLVNAMGNL